MSSRHSLYILIYYLHENWTEFQVKHTDQRSSLPSKWTHVIGSGILSHWGKSTILRNLKWKVVQCLWERWYHMSLRFVLLKVNQRTTVCLHSDPWSSGSTVCHMITDPAADTWGTGSVLSDRTARWRRATGWRRKWQSRWGRWAGRVPASPCSHTARVHPDSPECHIVNRQTLQTNNETSKWIGRQMPRV